MEATNNTSDKRYLSILSSTGKFHQSVPEGTDGAVKREYETSSGEKGVKNELVYSEVSGIITGLSFHDGDFGKNLQIELDDDGVVSVGVESSFGEDIMKKLPGIDLSSSVKLKPYAFTDDAGKNRRGVTIEQDGDKLYNYYYDNNAGKAVNGMPEFDGDMNDKDDWKMYFMKARKFLVKEVEALIAEKFSA